MAKPSAERRKQIVAEVAHKDELRRRNFERAKKMNVAKKLKPKPKVIKKPICCMDKHDDLPASFRPCIDCPNVNNNNT